MHVQQIQLRLFGHFQHFGRERQRVGRMIKKWIGGHLYFVKVDALMRRAQSNGHRVADEMDLMAARRQFDAQLGGYDARASVSWIARDSDFHGTSRHCNSHSSRAASGAVRLPWLAPGAAGC